MSALSKLKKIPMFGSVVLNYDSANHARHDHAFKFLKTQPDITPYLNKPWSEIKMLIFGCGYHYPEVSMFSTVCSHVEGIDTANAFYRDSIFSLTRDFIRTEGSRLTAPVKAFLKKYRFYAPYYHQLEKLFGQSFEHKNYNLTSYDGRHLPYPDSHFDLIVSNSVLEHVEDCHQAFQELHRVTSSGGISYHLWHNYYSFFGGHMPASVTNKYPWGHLRNKFETPYLNRLSPDQIQEIFSRHFNFIALFRIDRQYRKYGADQDYQDEKADLLTPEIRNEIADIPEEWLLTTAYLIVGRK